jgi:hypothetical protein
MVTSLDSAPREARRRRRFPRNRPSWRRFTNDLDVARVALQRTEERLERLTAVARYSSLYNVPADLAGAIYDIALAEGIHPSLGGFQLVKVESGFKPGARRQRGAIGYTQLGSRRAQLRPGLTESALEDRDTNSGSASVF